jgi:hypothetical protein
MVIPVVGFLVICTVSLAIVSLISTTEAYRVAGLITIPATKPKIRIASEKIRIRIRAPSEKTL